MISLECHANASTQLKMVKIMKQTWGNRLVDQSVENFDKNVPPSAMKGRILLIVSLKIQTFQSPACSPYTCPRLTCLPYLQVEWYPPDLPEGTGNTESSDTDSTSDSDSSSSEDQDKLHSFMERLKLHKKKKKTKHQHPKIIPELAELGVYAQSVKPKKDWLTQRKC